MRTLLFILLTLPGLAKADLYKTEVVAEGLSHPWSIDFLPDGAMLVADDTGGTIWHVAPTDAPEATPTTAAGDPPGANEPVVETSDGGAADVIVVQPD